MGLFLISDIKGLCFGAEDVKAAYIGSEQVWPVGSLPTGYIEFADPEVLRVLLAKGVGADGGITEEQAAAVTTIGAWFVGNTDIETFDEFEKFTGMTLIEGSASVRGGFTGCTNLRSIKLPQTLAKIYSGSDQYSNTGCFKNCTSLVDVNIPELIKVIPAFCFKNCNSLESVNLENINKIEAGAFEECTKLVITPPKSLTSIGEYAFIKCDMTGVVVDLPNLTSMSGYGHFAQTNIIGVESLGSITELLFQPDPPGYYGALPSFYKCTKLEYVNLPETLINIGRNMFEGCTALKHIYLPSSLTTIKTQVFKDCTSLETVICNSTTPPTLAVSSFNSTHANLFIYVPDDSVEAYKTATNWSTYADRIKPLSEYDGELPDIPQTPTYENITSNYTLEVGQAYGQEGGSIQFTTDYLYEHTKASISDVSYVMVKAPSQASSLVQYVNENDTILKIAITDFPSTMTRYYIENIEGATHIYVTSATGTMELWKEVIE